MTDGSSRTLAIADGARAEVTSVAIGPDGRLVATSSEDRVRDQQLLVGMYSGYSSYR